MSVKQTALASP